MAQAVFCGVSGWEHPEWHPNPKPRGYHPLERLVETFDTVEIGATFQEDPRPELAKVWLRRVSANSKFQFTAKLHRDLTHSRDLRAERVKAFRDGLLPLRDAGKLGCLLMQFPWSFRFTEENRKHLIELRRAFHEFPLAAEMRHASWMRDEALGVFIDYRIGFCNIDQPMYTKYMPPTSFLTSTIGYVRLHGRNCFRWFQPGTAGRSHRYDYLYSSEELAEWQSRIERVQPYADRTFVICNNDAGSKAVANARELKALLAGDPQPPSKRSSQNSLFGEFHSRAVA